MSTIRPGSDEECSQSPGAPGAPDRAAPAPSATPVSGPAEVQARVELHLAQCRRRRAGPLALLCVSVETVASATPGAKVSAVMEQQVRQEVSNRIGNAVRGTDSILRESDRDTCIVMPGASALVAQRVGARLERMVSGDYRIGDELLQVAVRVGSAAHPEHGAHAQDLLRRAGDRS